MSNEGHKLLDLTPRTDTSRKTIYISDGLEKVFHDLMVTDSELLEEYDLMVLEDAGVEQEVREAAIQMQDTPWDSLDKSSYQDTIQKRDQGTVQRRAPLNPFSSHKLGKWRLGGGSPKAFDPALRNNPLSGRLIVTIATTFSLLFVFLQCIVFNYTKTGRFHVPRSVNTFFGPEPQLLNDLGGLNTNEIRRKGEHVRLFWAMMMHSGWIHLLMNTVSQAQFLYMLEPDWGFWRSLICYFVSGLTGNLLSSVADPCSVTVGSSGALYGLMGAIIVYCIEYWRSIPRPCCILVFAIIVVAVSLISGFTANTDNWAHLGGLIGGILFSFMTITSTTVLEDCICFRSMKAAEEEGGMSIVPTDESGTPTSNKLAANTVVGADGRLKKKVVKRGKMAHFGQGLKPECKWGIREWIPRAAGFILLFTLIFSTSWSLYQNYEFQPYGHVTFKGVTGCCCCYSVKPYGIRQSWLCARCADPFRSSTWGEFCARQNTIVKKTREEQASSRRLLMLSEPNATAPLPHRDVTSLAEGERRHLTVETNAADFPLAVSNRIPMGVVYNTLRSVTPLLHMFPSSSQTPRTIWAVVEQQDDEDLSSPCRNGSHLLPDDDETQVALCDNNRKSGTISSPDNATSVVTIRT